MRSSTLLALTGLVLAASMARAAAANDCETISGLPQVLAHADILLLGEIHGSEQSPAFVGNLACAATVAGRSVTVGLEVALAEQERLDAYLSSDGGAAARKAVLAGPFWQSATQDGRESRAMLALLETLRQRKHAGAEVHVVALDPADPAIQPVERDRRMAATLVHAATRHPGDFVVSLTGNFHNRIHAAPWDSTYDFMGKVVTALAPTARVLSLNVVYSGGSAWMCEQTSGCGPHELKGRPAGDPPDRITLEPALDGDGYHGTYSVGKLSPAPPAATTGAH